MVSKWKKFKPRWRKILFFLSFELSLYIRCWVQNSALIWRSCEFTLVFILSYIILAVLYLWIARELYLHGKLMNKKQQSIEETLLEKMFVVCASLSSCVSPSDPHFLVGVFLSINGGAKGGGFSTKLYLYLVFHSSKLLANKIMKHWCPTITTTSNGHE